MREIQKTAATLGISVISKSVADATDLEQTIEEFAKGEDGALAVITSPKMTSLRQPIAQLAAKFRLPAVYPLRSYVEAGGHGISEVGMYEQVPEIIDLILKGKPPGDIPVEAPTKTEFLIKKNAATNLGLQIPNSLVTRGRRWSTKAKSGVRTAGRVCPPVPAKSGLGHSRPGRAGGKSGQVRYGAESGSKFRALAARL